MPGLGSCGSVPGSCLVPSQPGFNPRWCGLICPRVPARIYMYTTVTRRAHLVRQKAMYFYIVRYIHWVMDAGACILSSKTRQQKMPADGFEPHQADVHYVLT